jgi:putative spermidine/putrescine transport system ATP-binding protein
VGDFIRYYFKLPDGTDMIVKVLNDLPSAGIRKMAEAQLLSATKDCIAFQANRREVNQSKSSDMTRRNR